MQISSPLSQTAKLRRTLNRGESALTRGQFSAAEMAGRRVINSLAPRALVKVMVGSAQKKLLVASLELIARTRRELADFTEAAQLHEQALAVLDRQPFDPEEDNLQRVLVLGQLGETLRLLGRYAETEVHYRRAVLLAAGLQPGNALALATAINGLGIVFKDTTQFQKAGACYRKALSLAGEQIGAYHPQLAGIYHNLAGLQHAQDRFSEGEPFARHALRLRGKHEPSTSPGTAADLAVLGALLLGQGRYEEAENVLQQSLTTWQQRFGDSHYEVAVVLNSLAALYTARGEHERAATTHQRALDIKRSILGANHPEVTCLERHINTLTSNHQDKPPRTMARPSTGAANATACTPGAARPAAQRGQAPLPERSGTA